MSILLYDKMTMFNLINLCINLSVCLMSLGKEIFYFIMTKVRSAGFPGVGEHFVIEQGRRDVIFQAFA